MNNEDADGLKKNDPKYAGVSDQARSWLIGYSLAEIRRLIVGIILQAYKRTTSFILNWSLWRRQHQTKAMECHWKRRLKFRSV